MASNSKICKTKRAAKRRKQGLKRKRTLALASTKSYQELFAGFGPPSEPQAKCKD